MRHSDEFSLRFVLGIVPMPELFDINVARVQMTLCAISYVKGTGSDKTRPNPCDIEAELAKTGYATGGQWSLVWGPAYSAFDDNMMYLVQQDNTSNIAIVIRGTEAVDIKSWCEDVPKGMSDVSGYTHKQATLVSDEFADAISHLAQAVPVGSDDDRTLGAILDKLASKMVLSVIVTGHSQGGGLAPIMGAWIADRLAAQKAHVKVYAFAPPTPGNTEFASWVANALEAFHVANPHDLVPFGYARIGSVITDKVPVEVPEFVSIDGVPFPLRLGIDTADLAVKAIADLNDTSWAPAGTSHLLPAVAAPTDLDYLQQVDAQHNYNSYLYLLGAPQTDVGTKSPLEVRGVA
ncbi:lipase family protein [Ruegeria hyattellae]|uniref:lipase family protein n=1 Tax=Ruegeria hyattellae TaxID=3233337 RepID=UPI00355B42DB